jgi:hypothetical protein
MCNQVSSPTWSQHPIHRVPVGKIVDAEKNQLLSEGMDDNGVYHALWMTLVSNGKHTIDIVTMNQGKWTYRREYECDDLKCIASTFLGLVKK